MINTIRNPDLIEKKQGSLLESSFNNKDFDKLLKSIKEKTVEELKNDLLNDDDEGMINAVESKTRNINDTKTVQKTVEELKNDLFNEDKVDITKGSVELETRWINDKIMIQKTDIFYQNNKIENIKSLKDIIDYGLEQKRQPTKILQILVESIHKKTPRINVGDKDNLSFYCWDRALLIYQICEKYKEALGIRTCNIALPYGHVMDIVTLNDGKIYIVDSSAGCFNVW